MAKKLVLVDGHALAYRAFFALPVDGFSTSQGELTNAVYGFTMMLLHALQEEKPEYIAVTFDAPAATFRHEEFEEYKAHRPPMQEEMRSQMERIRHVVQALNIPAFEVPGYEADDLIGSLAQQASDQELETIIITGDNDIFQLVSPLVKVVTPGGHRQRFSDAKLYDEKGVKEKYGVAPTLLADYKGLVGDKSDNIPGVTGVGDKTARQLIQRYGTIEEIYEHLDEIESTRARKSLTGQKERAMLSKRLSTIVTDVPINLNLEQCRASDYDRDEVIALFRELEFRSLVQRLPTSDRERAQQMTLFAREAMVAGAHTAVTTEEQLNALLSELSRSPRMALDVETTSVDAMRADLVGLSFATKAGRAFYVPVGHLLAQDAEGQLPMGLVVERLRPVLEDASVAKAAHNGKYDLTVLARHGIAVCGLDFDTMIAAYLLEPSRRGFGLKDLAWSKLGLEMRPITELIGKGRDQVTLAQVSIADTAAYAGADADATLRLMVVLEDELRQREQWDLFCDVEMPLVEVLMEMEMAGVALDTAELMQISASMYQRIVALEEEIHGLAGHPFNVNSTQQLAEVLFEELGLPAKAKTKAGYSTRASVLEELRDQHAIIDLILEHRQLTKIKSTYVDSLPLLVDRDTGRVHTSYNQTGTVTGRISSSDPNLQNIPVRTELGRHVRCAFVAQEGWVLLGADYSQVELRILAHISQDPDLLAAFDGGEDIHASTASTVFEVPLTAVTPAMRRIAKSINFGIIYGMGEYGLAQRTDLSLEEARKFIASYFARYEKVKEYVEQTKDEAREQGYVSTLLGRSRYFPELQTTSRAHGGVKRAAEREAINMPIQGSAADILKIAMVRLHRALKEEDLAARMILQVHDELVLEVPQEELGPVAPLVRSVMENAWALDAALKVDLKVGKNWEQMEAYQA
ncbi:MAG: DNA polymerase I [Chloroflexi bacterium B3_Chlor]|nr:MAG: DNA polymerase I [Chloroflexi bacterium B3_Chlor]